MIDEEIIRQFIEERMLNRIGEEDLFDNPRITDFKGDVRVLPYYTPITIMNPVTRTAPQIIDGDALKVTEQDLDGRKEGEVLLLNDVIDLSGGAVAGAEFDTLGHQYLFVHLVVGLMATNPTALVCSLQISTDAFDTITIPITALDGAIITQTLPFADVARVGFFMPTQSNAGALAATNTPASSPIPNITNITVRFLFTPTGAAVTNEPMNYTVYGITPR